MGVHSIVRFFYLLVKNYVLDHIFLIQTTQCRLGDNTLKLKRNCRRKMWSFAAASLLAQLLLEKSILTVASVKSWKQFIEVGTNVLLGNKNIFLP